MCVADKVMVGQTELCAVASSLQKQCTHNTFEARVPQYTTKAAFISVP